MARREGRTRRVTLADVAKHADVSVSTASFVLSGRTDMRISLATTDRVLATARSLAYVPPRGNRASPLQQFPSIVFVSDANGGEQFLGPMVRGVVTTAAQHGYAVVVDYLRGDAGLTAGDFSALRSGSVGHVIYATTATREVHLPALRDGVRAVLANCFDPQQGHVPAIVPDDREAGARAARALIGAGHSNRIWLVGEVTRNGTAGGDRRSGLVDTLAEHRLAFERHLPATWWPPDAHRVTADALTAHRPPTAVVALNDRIALGVYQAAAEHGLVIPGDLSVISFDNSDLAWWLSPGLTSLGMPYFEMGRRAAQRLLGESWDIRRETVTMPLHERASVAGPAPRAAALVPPRRRDAAP